MLYADDLTALWNAKLVALGLVTEQDTKNIFLQSYTNCIPFIINKVTKKPYSASSAL